MLPVMLPILALSIDDDRQRAASKADKITLEGLQMHSCS